MIPLAIDSSRTSNQILDQQARLRQGSMNVLAERLTQLRRCGADSQQQAIARYGCYRARCLGRAIAPHLHGDVVDSGLPLCGRHTIEPNRSRGSCSGSIKKQNRLGTRYLMRQFRRPLLPCDNAGYPVDHGNVLPPNLPATVQRRHRCEGIAAGENQESDWHRRGHEQVAQISILRPGQPERNSRILKRQNV